MLMNLLLAFAAGEQGASPYGTLWSLFPILLIFPIFYFLVIMPQQKARKKQQALLASLKKGDKVISTSGIMGTIVSVDKNTVILQVAPDVKLRMMRNSISGMRTEE